MFKFSNRSTGIAIVVYLLSEYATHALTGSLYCQILPLLL
ncbi:hypothetical protein [Nostoc sp. CHAB 5836]